MRYILAVVLGLALIGCGEDKLANLPKYDQMKNLGEAPAAIQKAAPAVVRILVGDTSSGTGSFISKDGLLLTNNHVLGIQGLPCPQEGCFISINRNYQVGSPYAAAETVFAEPQRVSPELDAAVYQLWRSSAKSAKYTVDTALEISPESAAALMNRTVYVVGHPQGGLKKWSEGQVFASSGDWIRATNYSLHGNSGSPFLDEQGRLVGILHRGEDDPSVLAKHDANYFSIGSSSEALAKFLSSPVRIDPFPSVKTRRASIADIAKHQLEYLLNHQPNAINLDGTQTKVIDALAEACDGVLKRERFNSPNELDSEIDPCSAAWSWMNCANGLEDYDYKSCPGAEAAQKWRGRWAGVAEKAQQFNSIGVYRWLLSGWRLESSYTAQTHAEKEALDKYLAGKNPPLSLQLAYYLIEANFGEPVSYQGRNVVDFMRHYRDKPHYELEYNHVINGHRLLYGSRMISRSEFKSALEEMFDDDHLDVGNKLWAEEIAYMYGFI